MKKLDVILVVTLLGCAMTQAIANVEVIRNSATARAFEKLLPCPYDKPHKPGTCPNWVVDHINPLKCLGPDAVSNMQWQTYSDSKKKDRWEIRGDATHKPCSGLPQ